MGTANFGMPAPHDPKFGHAMPVGDFPLSIGVFTVLQVLDDYLICEGYDALTRKFYNNAAIAKPYLLQRTPWDEQTIDLGDYTVTYTYINDYTRQIEGYENESSEAFESAVESIDPPYFVGDRITAIRRDVEAVQIGGENIQWEDLNLGARKWSAYSSTTPTVHYFAIITDNANQVVMEVSRYGRTIASLSEDPIDTELLVHSNGTALYYEDELIAVVQTRGAWYAMKLLSSSLWDTDIIGWGQLGIHCGSTPDTKWGPVIDARYLLEMDSTYWSSNGYPSEHFFSLHGSITATTTNTGYGYDTFGCVVVENASDLAGLHTSGYFYPYVQGDNYEYLFTEGQLAAGYPHVFRDWKLRIVKW